MAIDILLISSPNRNIDYPSLALPSLSGALKSKGISSKLIDLNILIRDDIITEKGLSDLVNKTIPILMKLSINNVSYLMRLKSVKDFLIQINIDYGFKLIEEVKKSAQKRNYDPVFSNDRQFKTLLNIFQINRAIHNIIEASVLSLSELKETYLECIITKNLNNIKRFIQKNNPLAVGLSIMDIQRAFSLILIENIRAYYKGPIIIGGADPTRFPLEYLKKYSEIDIVFWREADLSLPIYINTLKEGKKDFKDIPSIYYRNETGGIKKNKSTNISFDSLSTPIFDDLPLNKYLTPTLPIQSSRGCYYQKCNFCIHYDTYNKHITRSPKKVAADIKALSKKYNTRFFHFTDDALPLKNAKELFKALSSLKDIKWLSYIRLEGGFDEETFDLMKTAGASVLEVGLESASSHLLKKMNKNISIKNAQSIIDLASNRNILVKMFMFHDYPGETIDDLLSTIDFVKNNVYQQKVRPFFPLRNKFELLKGSQIYFDAMDKQNSFIKKVWKPSGAFSIRANYINTGDYSIKEDLIQDFLNQMNSYISKNNIYSTNDENITLDLLTLDYGDEVKYKSI